MAAAGEIYVTCPDVPYYQERNTLGYLGWRLVIAVSQRLANFLQRLSGEACFNALFCERKAETRKAQLGPLQDLLRGVEAGELLLDGVDDPFLFRLGRNRNF